mmetsp:Transcript_419/g.986  ORF Transcript_419/g.986 Transcript_419/m.986 type:complete len:340 (+) Transcript_419:1231-2250(+)
MAAATDTLFSATMTIATAMRTNRRALTAVVAKTASMGMPNPPRTPVGPIPPRRGTCLRRRLSTAAIRTPISSAPIPGSSPSRSRIRTPPPTWAPAASWFVSWRPWAMSTRSSAFRTARPSRPPAGCEAPASMPSPSGPSPSAKSFSMVSMPRCFRPKRKKRALLLPQKVAMAVAMAKLPLSRLLEPRPGWTSSRSAWPPTATSSPSPSPPSCATVIATSTLPSRASSSSRAVSSRTGSVGRRPTPTWDRSAGRTTRPHAATTRSGARRWSGSFDRPRRDVSGSASWMLRRRMNRFVNSIPRRMVVTSQSSREGSLWRVEYNRKYLRLASEITNLGQNCA